MNYFKEDTKRAAKKSFHYALPKSIVNAIGDGEDKSKEQYIVKHVLDQQLHKEKQHLFSDDYAFMDTDHLNEVLGINYRAYVRNLVDKGILDKLSESLSVKSNEYKVSTWFERDDYLVIEISHKEDKKLYNGYARVLKNRNVHYLRQEDYVRVMRNYILDEMTFDAEGAIEWLKENTTDEIKQDHHFNNIFKIADKRERFADRNTTNQRFDTSVTNLKPELRAFIDPEIDKAHIKLKNSLPFFLSELIMGILQNRSDLKDHISSENREYLSDIRIYLNISAWDMCKTFGFESFISVVDFLDDIDILEYSKFSIPASEGTIYDEFAELLGDGTTGEEAKEIFFEELFSINLTLHKSLPFYNERKKFAEVYPIIAGVINILKKEDYRSLAITLKKLESLMFIDLIAQILISEDIIPITIHDSVMVPYDKTNEALDIIEDVFEEAIESVPTFVVEKIEKRS